jgi:Tol biopolymer transport system component
VRGAAVAMALASLVTVPQHDRLRSNLDAPYVSVSGDGRYVALITQERLVPADTNTGRDVYVLDRDSGNVSLDSFRAHGGQSSEDPEHPAGSRDGRFLVYESGDRVVWRDRIEGTAVVLAPGREPAINADGRLVAFTSANGVMVMDVASRAVSDASSDAAGRPIPYVSNAPSLSGDGRYLAFASTAALTESDEIIPSRSKAEATGGQRRRWSQVYVRDLQQGITRLVSVGIQGKPADGDSWRPAISADGGVVAFVSDASNLVRNDRNHSSDIFLVNLSGPAGVVELVTRNGKGDAGNGASVRPAISFDGQFVVFQSEASDLDGLGTDINLLWDVFRFDRRAGKTARLSADKQGAWMEASGGPAIDAAGDVVAFSSRHPIDATDTLNDFDLFVLNLASPSYYLGR